GQYVDSPRTRPQQCLFQRDSYLIAASLRVAPPARMVHENPADDLCAKGKEMQTVFAVYTARSNQFEIRLIDQGRRFQSVVTAGQMDSGNSPQLRVDHPYQAV